MATVREIITKWGFKADVAPLDRVENRLNAIKGQVNFLASLQLLGPLNRLVEQFVSFADELQATAISAGLTTTELQKLSFAASQNAVSQEEMTGAMAKLGKQLYEARNGSKEAADAFARAGITGDQIRSFKTSKDALFALADSFSGMTDPIKKQAISMELLGRGSHKMVGFLSEGSGAIRRMGSEAERVGAIVGEDNIRALADAEDALSEFWTVIKAIGATIASYFAPSIQQAVKAFLDFYAANRKLIETNIKQWVDDVTFAFGYIYGVLEVVIKRFLEFAESHKDLVRNGVLLLAGIFILAVVAWLASAAFGFLGGAIDAVGFAIDALMFLISPGGIFILALLAIIVAIHDLWAISEGEPTWIGQFLEWIGISEEVDQAFQDMFQAISDAWNNLIYLFENSHIYKAFEKLGQMVEAFKNAILGAKQVVVDLLNLDFRKAFSGALQVGADVDKGIGAGIAAGDEAANIPVDIGNAIALPLDLLASTLDSGADAFNDLVRKANIPVISDAFLRLADAKPPTAEGATGTTNNVTVDAPITVNVPPGTNPEKVGDSVKAGVKEHLDQVYREVQRTLRPTVAY